MTKKFKNFGCIFVLLIAAALLSACGTSQTTEQATEQKITEQAQEEVTYEAPVVDTSRPTTADSSERYEKIVIATDMDPQDLLPYNVNNGSKPYIYFNIYECLFDYEGTEYVPVLAKGYEVVDDLHYDVEIYDYIYDHAGNHITADDVVFSYKVLLESGYAIKYNSFADIEKVDDYTVRFTWALPITGVGDLEFPWCRSLIFSQKAYEEGGFATKPIGTGPYKVANFVSGSSVVLEAVDDYWQTDAAKISKRHEANVQTIQYDIITETSQHVIALQSGSIDFSEKIPVENLSDFEGSTDYGVYTAPGSFLYLLTPNCTEGRPAADINFRKAVYYAIDNDACATVSNGSTMPAKAIGSSFFSDYVVAWDEQENYVNTYNPELAKEYLSKSSYNGETIVLEGPNDETAKNNMTIIQSFLLNIGIKCEISALDQVISDNNFSESDIWDLKFHKLGGGVQIGQWNRILSDKEFGTGKSCGFIDDPVLLEKFAYTRTAENHNDESMTDLHNYMLENAYQYAVGTGKLNIVYTNDIAELYLRDRQYILPGACTYYLD